MTRVLLPILLLATNIRAGMPRFWELHSRSRRSGDLVSCGPPARSQRSCRPYRSFNYNSSSSDKTS